ncbi:MAG TPA: C40 family peptidase [Gemmatimonadales bacterium]|nr:C40 family peptidase [Gemmatimonadales bacterium]
MRRVILAGLVSLTLPGVLAAQSITVGASRWLNSPHVSEYRVGVGGFGKGPIRLVYSAQYLKQSGDSKAHWYGAGGDLILRPITSAQPYFLVGAAVGAGRGPTGGGEQPGVGLWGGVGAEIVTVGPIALQAEALYHWRSGVQLSGLSLGLRLGTPFGHRPVGTPTPASEIPSANPSDEEAIRLATAARKSNTPAGEIVASALTVMGTPYKWGGTDSLGFDCSGLIRYAYGQHGVTLPRMAVDQARTGSEVGRALDQLMPGDILTFADQPGGPVTHVGLYIGEGQFIHSARGGVQISALSASDSIGKWWFARWVGARRLL